MKSKTSKSSRNSTAINNPRLSEDTPVQYIKGVGPARAKILEKLGITSLGLMLYYFPWRYEDRKNLKNIADLLPGTQETTAGTVMSSNVITTPRKRMKIFEIIIADDTGQLQCRWFNQAFLKKYFPKDQKVIVSGMVKGNPYSGFGLEMDNPDFELIGNEDKRIHTARIVPVYKATEGISVKQLRTLMFNSLESYLSLIRDYMPEDILKRHNLPPLDWSIREAHFPEDYSDMNSLNSCTSPAHKRIVFDEFFLLELGLAILKTREAQEKGIRFSFNRAGLINRFRKNLPFTLTNAQERVVTEIASDMERDRPMNRLVHGDVGCGKTIVALHSMLIAVENGYQACLMAPTELLAEQHYINVRRVVEDLGLSATLLTSGSKDKALAEIAEGSIQIIIGTHALIQDQVIFNKLGLAIIDEQHRFGVVQRAALRSKGNSPDILVMTATPIPRTLALTLYGDLDISVIDELPAGRKPITTKVYFPSQKEGIHTKIRQELSRGRQVYIVYPLIEESEKLDLKSAMDGAEAMQKKYPGNTVALVHGKMKHDEREDVMAKFKSGKIDILVATTVIEVGIDVPNASLMLIVHAERFGLAQLHQLRGRIGRGAYDSYCLLLAYPPFSDDGKSRLKAMESTGDGFRIAEEDLAIRGPGDFFGTRQSGIPDLQIANIVRDVKILEIARHEAFSLAEKEPELTTCPALKEKLHSKWMGRLELIKS